MANRARDFGKVGRMASEISGLDREENYGGAEERRKTVGGQGFSTGMANANNSKPKARKKKRDAMIDGRSSGRKDARTHAAKVESQMRAPRVNTMIRYRDE